MRIPPDASSLSARLRGEIGTLRRISFLAFQRLDTADAAITHALEQLLEHLQITRDSDVPHGEAVLLLYQMLCSNLLKADRALSPVQILNALPVGQLSVQIALEALSLRSRLAIGLTYMSSFNAQQISKILDLSVADIDKLLEQSMFKLMKQVSD